MSEFAGLPRGRFKRPRGFSSRATACLALAAVFIGAAPAHASWFGRKKADKPAEPS